MSKRTAQGTVWSAAKGGWRRWSLWAERIPAIVIDAPPEERYLMSLIENIARHKPSSLELVREVRSLMGRGHGIPAVAEKLGMHTTYIQGVARLLRKGEEQLIAQVEAGALPLDIAVKIAGSSTQEVRKALNDAYESGQLRGNKFRAAQSLIARRLAALVRCNVGL